MNTREYIKAEGVQEGIQRGRQEERQVREKQIVQNMLKNRLDTFSYLRSNRTFYNRNQQAKKRFLS